MAISANHYPYPLERLSLQNEENQTNSHIYVQISLLALLVDCDWRHMIDF